MEALPPQPSPAAAQFKERHSVGECGRRVAIFGNDRTASISRVPHAPPHAVQAVQPDLESDWAGQAPAGPRASQRGRRPLARRTTAHRQTRVQTISSPPRSEGWAAGLASFSSFLLKSRTSLSPSLRLAQLAQLTHARATRPGRPGRPGQGVPLCLTSPLPASP